MKRIILSTLFFVLVIFSNAQNYDGSIGLGFSVINLDVGTSSPVGLVLEMDFFKVHMDVATNMAKGKGEYLDFSSSWTTSSEKQSWLAFNLGYDFKISNHWYIVPKAGCVILDNIWEDPVGWNTYFTENSATTIQAGLEIKRKVNGMYIKASSCTTEIFSTCIGFAF